VTATVGRPALSISDALMVIVTGSSSLVEAETSFATGGWFTATVKCRVAVAVPPSVRVSETVNVYSPFARPL
jgi:hypothetical protein